MHILVDHYVHTTVTEALKESGFKVTRVFELGLEKASDEEIFNLAVEKDYILLTFDKDFGNIIRFDIKKSAGVVIVYIEGLPKVAITKRVVDFFQSISPENLRGTLTIVDFNTIRIWPK